MSGSWFNLEYITIWIFILIIPNGNIGLNKLYIIHIAKNYIFYSILSCPMLSCKFYHNMSQNQMSNASIYMWFMVWFPLFSLVENISNLKCFISSMCNAYCNDLFSYVICKLLLCSLDYFKTECKHWCDHDLHSSSCCNRGKTVI